MKTIKISRYKQNSQEFVSFNINFESLYQISTVLVYERDPGGYQRLPNELHINKIKKYILSDEDFLLPTSIILGVDLDVLDKHLKKDGDIEYLDISNLSQNTFRIVDGQHRIKGLAKAIVGAQPHLQQKLNDFTFNVVCVITDENTRSKELQIFVDINSKGKKVSTDLAELAKYNYEIIEEKVENNISSISEHIAMKVSRELRENAPNSVWNYAIKFDIHSKLNIGIIGVSSFRKSITRTIQMLIENEKPELLNMSGQELIDECNNLAKKYKDFFVHCWDEIVLKKWSDCFEQRKVLDEYENFVSVWYSKDYYIQKPLGVKSINKLIEEIVQDSSNKSIDEILPLFKSLITDSKVQIENWEIGKTFSGLNSESGFKKIRQMIKNEIPIPKSND